MQPHTVMGWQSALPGCVGIWSWNRGAEQSHNITLLSPSVVLFLPSLAFYISTFPTRYHLLELGNFIKQQLEARHWLLEQYWLDFKLFSDLHRGKSALLLLILIKTMCSGPHGNIIGRILSPIVHPGDSTANTNLSCCGRDAGCLGSKAMFLSSQWNCLSSKEKILSLWKGCRTLIFLSLPFFVGKHKSIFY